MNCAVMTGIFPNNHSIICMQLVLIIVIICLTVNDPSIPAIDLKQSQTAQPAEKKAAIVTYSNQIRWAPNG